MKVEEVRGRKEESGQYTRDQFVARIRKLLTDFELDHEEHTGISAEQTYEFDTWCEELCAVEDNA